MPSLSIESSNYYKHTIINNLFIEHNDPIVLLIAVLSYKTNIYKGNGV